MSAERVANLATLERMASAAYDQKRKSDWDDLQAVIETLRERWEIPECADHDDLPESDTCPTCGAEGDAE